MKRIGILVVAYNAASTLAHVLDRIPEEFRSRISEVLVGDDHSQDSTHLVGLGYQQENADLPLTVVRHPRNLGYGGNQKAGYQWAIDNDLDIVVLLHGDGQYAPECLPQIVEPLERDEVDAVFGSRMLDEGEARRGGMPLYKYVGNRILTTFENKVVGLDLSEWHSGYRAYSVSALKDIPFRDNDDGFNFDTQIIIQLREASKRIAEVPIPTYYGDEICYVDGMKYAGDVTKDVVRYRAHKMGFGTGEMTFADQGYELKESDDTSHVRLLSWLRGRPASRILDLGCSDGSLAELLAGYGHTVTGVDIEKIDGVGARVDQFIEADLDQGIPDEVGHDYDVVLAADVLEHVREPGNLMREIRRRLRPGGSLVTSIPNFAHWYPRARVALGRFDYDRRGILDRGHVRFFTRRSFERLVDDAGFDVRRREAVGLPLEVVDRGAGDTDPTPDSSGYAVADAGRQRGGTLGAIDRFGVSVWPNLFAYQYLYELGALSDPG